MCAVTRITGTAVWTPRLLKRPAMPRIAPSNARRAMGGTANRFRHPRGALLRRPEALPKDPADRVVCVGRGTRDSALSPAADAVVATPAATVRPGASAIVT